MKQEIEPASWWYELALAAALYFILLGGIFSGVLWMHGALFRGELLLHTLPNLEFGQQWTGRGILPLWDPYVAGGTPWLAAPQVAALYPVNRSLAAFLPGLPALHDSFLFHLWLAGMSLYLLARKMGLDFSASLAGGVLLMLSGPLLGRYDHFTAFCTLAWVPAVFLCLEFAAERPLPLAVPAGALILACQFLAGEPELTLGIWLVATGLALGRACGGRQNREPTDDKAVQRMIREGIRSSDEVPPAPRQNRSPSRCWCVLSLLAVPALAAGLAAVQILPSLEYLAHTNWPATATGTEMQHLVQHPFYKLLYRFIAPHFDGLLLDDVRPVYVSISAFLLVCMAFASESPNRSRWLIGSTAGLFLMVLAVAAGHILPSQHFDYLLDRLYLVGLSVLAVSLSLLAALGFQAAGQADSEKRSRWTLPLGLGWAILILATVLAYASRLYLADLPWQAAIQQPYFHYCVQDLLAGSAGLLLVFWVTLNVSWLKPAVRAAGTLCILVLTLGPFARGYVELGPRNIHQPSREILELFSARDGKDSAARIYIHPAAKDDFEGARFLKNMARAGLVDKAPNWKNDILLGDSPARYGLSAISGYRRFPLPFSSPFRPEALRPAVDPGRNVVEGRAFLYDAKELKMLGCAWLLAPTTTPLTDELRKEWKPVWNSGSVVVYHNPSAKTLPTITPDHIRCQALSFKLGLLVSLCTFAFLLGRTAAGIVPGTGDWRAHVTL